MEQRLADFYLDIQGQQPLLNIYTQICLCYGMPDLADPDTIVSILNKGLERLTTSFPWIAGQVVADDAGAFKIVPFEKSPRLVIKDYREDPTVPTMDALRKENFPFSMLDESRVAPRHTIPTPDEANMEKAVFLVQACFIKGGFLLNFNGQHQAMDMTGQGQMMDLLWKACRNEPFTAEELSVGNLARRHLVPLLEGDTYETNPHLERQRFKPAGPAAATDDPANIDAAPPPQCRWAYFSFPAKSLQAIKAEASKTVKSGFISTDDALCAFIWQAVIRARAPRYSTDNKSTFARAVDIRRYLGIPPTYTGLMQNMSYHDHTFQELASMPLGAIAYELRAAVDPQTSQLGYNTRALATFLDRSATKTDASVTASLRLDRDIMLSSWTKPDCYSMDFGLGLGKPESVRRPQFVPVESLMYFMPRRLDGEISAALCLREEDWARIIVDEEVARLATYIP